jgi:hypothetical protein
MRARWRRGRANHPLMPQRSTLGGAVMCGLFALSAVAHTQERQPTFSGLLLAVDGARQSVIAGALHAGVDVLHQQTKFAALGSIGVRGQLPIGTVIGIELGAGPLHSRFVQSEPAMDIRVRYLGSRQRSIGAQLGQVVGARRRSLIYAYAYEMTRTFDVTIEGPFGGSSTFPVTGQRDEQGILRFGLGVERMANDWLSVRVNAGTARADFGNRPTNIDVSRPFEFGVGLVARAGLGGRQEGR